MTLAELKSLTGSQLRILVAEAEGYSPHSSEFWKCPDGVIRGGDIDVIIPKYDSDRDAITEAILRRLARTRDDYFSRAFGEALNEILGSPGCDTFTSITTIATASAEDLCRAFLASIKTHETEPT